MKIFDKIEIDNNKYVLTLSQTNPDKVVAIGKDFNRFADAVKVKNFNDISEKEMKKIVAGHSYTKIQG